jgi:hypothetical protein
LPADPCHTTVRTGPYTAVRDGYASSHPTDSEVIGYLVLWFYWKGRNWARLLVLLTSLLALYNLRYWSLRGIAGRIMLGAEAALAIFLLYWLNTRRVREFFITPKS